MSDKRAVALNKCKENGCNPVEQTRSEMKAEDHHRQFIRLNAAIETVHVHGIWLPLNDLYDDAHNVEVLEEHANDFRISCSKCGKATGWDRCDKEEFRNHGAGDNRRHVVERDANKDSVRERWNRLLAGDETAVMGSQPVNVRRIPDFQAYLEKQRPG